jgi:hypothetical protein
VEDLPWPRNDFCHCFCVLIRVLSGGFKFELIAIRVIVRPVPDGARAVSTGTVVTAGMPGLWARSVLRCSAIGVRNVS